jgi:hypothetical protein
LWRNCILFLSFVFLFVDLRQEIYSKTINDIDLQQIIHVLQQIIYLKQYQLFEYLFFYHGVTRS